MSKLINLLRLILSLIFRGGKKLITTKMPIILFFVALCFMQFWGNIKGTDPTIIEQIQSNTKGNDKRFLYYNNKEIDEMHPQYQLLLQDNIISVKRNCESLFKCIPSGILTPLAWFIGGSAVRHEYVIIQTTNFLVTIELKQKNGDYFIIQNLMDYTKKIDSILEKRNWNRELDSLEQQDIGQLKFIQLENFMSLILVCWSGINMFKKGKYEVLFKNCKNLSRSICYFCAKKTELDNIMQSILGLYTDYFCDILKRTEIQWILDFYYDQTISSVTKIKEIQHEIQKMRNDKIIQLEDLPNWNIL